MVQFRKTYSENYANIEKDCVEAIFYCPLPLHIALDSNLVFFLPIEGLYDLLSGAYEGGDFCRP